MYNKRIIISLIISLALSNGYSQKYNVKTYSVNDGLPSSQVYDVQVDEIGLVWLATAYGLVKFDGYDFKTYDTSHGLRDELIYDIYLDSKHNFWISTASGGVGLFANDSIHYLPELEPLNNLTIQHIIESPTSELWFGTLEGAIIIWNPANSSFRKLGVEEGLIDSTIWDIYFDKEGRTWIGSWEGVTIYTEGQGVIKTIKVEDGLTGVGAYQIFEAEDGRKWIPTRNGISIINQDYSIDSITSLDGEDLNSVYNISQDDEGIMWIGTEKNGLYWYDESNKNVTHITKKNGLSSNYIYRLIKAQDGTIWVATDGNGVNIFKDKKFNFYNTDSGYGFNGAYSIINAHDGSIWIGTDNAISNYRDGSFKSYLLPKDKFLENEIWDIEELSNGDLLLLTYDYKLIKFDGTEFTPFEFNSEMPSRYVNDIYIEGDTIWLGVEDGLLRYKNGFFEKFKPPNNDWTSFVSSIMRDSKGVFWLGTENGLASFDGEKFHLYTEQQGLRGTSVNEVVEDRFGNKWIGTNKGISVLVNNNENQENHQITSFSQDQMYLNETISLQFDKNGGLWQGTNGGLNHYDVEKWKKTGTLDKIHYALQDYGRGVEMSGSASLIDKDGRLWFGTARNGLVVYEPSNHKNAITYEPPPDTYIRSVYANGDMVYDQGQKSNLGDLDIVELDFNQSSVEIKFGAVNYKDPYRIFYRYRLVGFEYEWHADFDIQEAVYTNLEPGKYEFQVMAKSVKSVWGNSPTIMRVIVNKPFWLTFGFYFFVFTIIIGFIILYINIHLSVAEKKRLKILVDEQTRDLLSAIDEKEVLVKEVHHRVKNNLAVISGLFELQMFKAKDENVCKVLKESQMRIRSMSIIHEQLYQNDSLSKICFATYIKTLLEAISKTMHNDLINISIHADIDESINMTITQAVPCGLILNEILTNAYEHAFLGRTSGFIGVIIKEDNGWLKMLVQDDGIGLDTKLINESNESLGITLVKTLTKQLKGRLQYINEDGSTFIVNFKKDKVNVGFVDQKEVV